VSHHLNYKSEFGVPAELKRDFHALSGLFHVADTHFEMFATQVSDFRESLKKIEMTADGKPIRLNHDVIHLYLLKTFPDREAADSESVEEFLAEVSAAGYTSVQDVDRDIQRGLPALEIGERENPPCEENGNDETRFTSIGAARGALDMANQDYRQKRSRVFPDSYAEYRNRRFGLDSYCHRSFPGGRLWIGGKWPYRQSILASR
jgi:putative GTP pyrophosphokinase